jgi:hypothetical protein
MPAGQAVVVVGAAVGEVEVVVGGAVVGATVVVVGAGVVGVGGLEDVVVGARVVVGA